MLPIGIEVDHVPCPFGQRIIHPGLESGSLAQIDRVAQIVNGPAFEDIGGPVRRSVIDDDNRIAVGKQSTNRSPQDRAFVVSGYHHEDLRLDAVRPRLLHTCLSDSLSKVFTRVGVNNAGSHALPLNGCMMTGKLPILKGKSWTF